MGETGIIILFFVIVFIVVLVVGFIGNKISDGVSNAVRAKKVQREQQNPRHTQSESLAARLNRMQPQATRMPERQVSPQQAVLQQGVLQQGAPQQGAPQLQFCTKCGQPLDAAAQWCHACGTKLEP